MAIIVLALSNLSACPCMCVVQYSSNSAITLFSPFAIRLSFLGLPVREDPAQHLPQSFVGNLFDKPTHSLRTSSSSHSPAIELFKFRRRPDSAIGAEPSSRRASLVSESLPDHFDANFLISFGTYSFVKRQL